MNTLKTTLAIAALALASITVVPNQASACGVIGCILNEVAPGSGLLMEDPIGHDWVRRFDVEEANGKAAAERQSINNSALEGLIPDLGNSHDDDASVSTGGIVVVAAGAVAVRSEVGNVCLTPYGRSVPGPYQPVGTSCYIWDSYGRQVWGLHHSGPATPKRPAQGHRHEDAQNYPRHRSTDPLLRIG